MASTRGTGRLVGDSVDVDGEDGEAQRVAQGAPRHDVHQVEASRVVGGLEEGGLGREPVTRLEVRHAVLLRQTRGRDLGGRWQGGRFPHRGRGKRCGRGAARHGSRAASGGSGRPKQHAPGRGLTRSRW